MEAIGYLIIFAVGLGVGTQFSEQIKSLYVKVIEKYKEITAKG